MSTLLFFLTILPSLTPLAQAGLSTGAIIEAALVPNKQIEIAFDDASELKVGTAVNIDGVKVGEVVEINSTNEQASPDKAVAAKAVIRINQQSALSLLDINIALVSTQLSNVSKNSTVIELLSLKSLSSQKNIVGFSSHEKFWNSPLI
jgi:MlaD protein